MDKVIPTLLTSEAGSVVARLLGGTEHNEVIYQDDESFEENCEFIYKAMDTRDVHITKDMPEIYGRCALDIGNASLLASLDSGMKVAMLHAMTKIKEQQAANGGFISFKKLKAFFEENGELFLPVPDDDIETDKHLFQDSGFQFDLTGAANMAMVHQAREVMQACVNEKGGMEIWDSLVIDTEALANLFGETGVAVRDFESLLASTKRVARVAIDIGVARFPRTEDPFFKVHRFRVIVFKAKTRILMFHSGSAGVFCRFQSRKYRMTDRFMSKFTPEVSAQVDEKFKDVMKDLGINI